MATTWFKNCRSRAAAQLWDDAVDQQCDGRTAQKSAPQSLAERARIYCLAFLDQGLFTGSNLVINLLLARSLEPREYGAFAVGFSVLTFLFTGYSAVLIEPLLVFGAERYQTQFGEYFAIVLYVHAAVTGGAGVLLGLAGL